MKTLSKTIVFIALFSLFSCSKDDDNSTDVKNLFIGNWSGQQQIVGASNPYAFDLIIYSDNTLKNIDLAFSSQEFPGSYTYTNDSLKINYNNGTKWKLKFSNNYTSCSGSVLGAQGATGTVTMSKN
ncbi:hypothetical protein QWY90_12580 [Flavobacterium paronense]|uniref:Lipocalin-like domain-containing protein n=1 Tax=Flavobacterium paronense TaxID=1392775 RepID=A0ABV5GDY8_9FLAO|nr:hypothetical protein [Flavobacterium paronense]MDN3678142.1 hypothetical protein [Flavobacterium paronense]